MKLVMFVGIGLVLLALLLPALRDTRPAARRVQCSNNLKQIGLALLNYESAYGAFPPAHTVDGDGKPLHSWRALILPFLNEQSLYEKIDFSKPWNDAANVEAYNKSPHAYRCPTAEIPVASTMYLAIVTSDSCLRPLEPRSVSEITDGVDNTWIVIEIPLDRAVHWMDPTDADEQLVLGFGDKSKFYHTSSTHVLLADGSVRFVSTKIPAKDRQALISIDGHEKIPEY